VAVAVDNSDFAPQFPSSLPKLPELPSADRWIKKTSPWFLPRERGPTLKALDQALTVYAFQSNQYIQKTSVYDAAREASIKEPKLAEAFDALVAAKEEATKTLGYAQQSFEKAEERFGQWRGQESRGLSGRNLRQMFSGEAIDNLEQVLVKGKALMQSAADRFVSAKPKDVWVPYSQTVAASAPDLSRTLTDRIFSPAAADMLPVSTERRFRGAPDPERLRSKSEDRLPQRRSIQLEEERYPNQVQQPPKRLGGQRSLGRQPRVVPTGPREQPAPRRGRHGPYR
jgi:hypothetical protein